MFQLFHCFKFLIFFDDTKKESAAALTTIGFAKGGFETTKGKKRKMKECCKDSGLGGMSLHLQKHGWQTWAKHLNTIEHL
jgi:hypothetical protein